MHSEPQISLHEIGPFRSSSADAMIHRLCTDQFIRAELSDKMQQIPCVCLGIALDSTNGDFQCKKTGMMKAIPVLVMGAVAATAGCASGKLGGATDRSGAVQRDCDRLTGTWQLTRGVVNGKAGFRKCVAKNNSDRRSNTFRFPKASGLGTHPAGTFTVNPSTRPKQVDSIADGGPHAGQLTRGIYEILDANHKRACWGQPGGARPTEFESPPDSGPILQYWKKVGPVPSH
jgi:uncharacterized protein (TIGR03067 family)